MPHKWEQRWGYLWAHLSGVLLGLELEQRLASGSGDGERDCTMVGRWGSWWVRLIVSGRSWGEG
jgi:hypothetical protein